MIFRTSSFCLTASVHPQGFEPKLLYSENQKDATYFFF